MGRKTHRPAGDNVVADNLLAGLGQGDASVAKLVNAAALQAASGRIAGSSPAARNCQCLSSFGLAVNSIPPVADTSTAFRPRS